MPEYLVKRIAPDATALDRLFPSREQADRFYDDTVNHPDPDTVARVVMYERGNSTAIRSDDVKRDEGPVTAPATAGPEPLNTEGHVVRESTDRNSGPPENVTVSSTEQIEPEPSTVVPDSGDSQGAVTAVDANVPGAVPPSDRFTEATGDAGTDTNERAQENTENEQSVEDAPGFDFRTGDSNVTDTDNDYESHGS